MKKSEEENREQREEKNELFILLSGAEQEKIIRGGELNSKLSWIILHVY
jgi:hypothetical protein